MRACARSKVIGLSVNVAITVAILCIEGDVNKECNIVKVSLRMVLTRARKLLVLQLQVGCYASSCSMHRVCELWFNSVLSQH